MHQCIYCNCKFNSRKQVKNPKACFKPECQKRRQRDNERIWHEKHRDRFDKQYCKTRRKMRKDTIFTIIEEIANAAKTGLEMIGQVLDIVQFRTFLQKTLPFKGLRYANKLWSEKSA